MAFEIFIDERIKSALFTTQVKISFSDVLLLHRLLLLLFCECAPQNEDYDFYARIGVNVRII